MLGDIAFTIDGEPLDFADTVTYRGMMFTGVPNLAWVFGYFRASWTLRADLVADFVCRLLDHMEDAGREARDGRAAPRGRATCRCCPGSTRRTSIRATCMRGMHLLPSAATEPEWQHTQDYWTEKDVFPAIDLDDDVFVYTPA